MKNFIQNSIMLLDYIYNEILKNLNRKSYFNSRCILIYFKMIQGGHLNISILKY